ncbi:cupin domain-containing protein [Stella sp.]|uniref:cupin domain-containing protein n=1 Tax=Stella sp. TaxID=2912054 RepID=UPI0035B0D125
MTRIRRSPAARLAAAILPLAAAAALAAPLPAGAAEPHHTVVPADTVRWGAAPPSLPPGAQAAVLLGSPAKEGPFVLRLRFPDGFTIPPHRHSKDEFVTVIAGGFAVAAGDRLDPKARALPAGSFVHLPAGMPHFARAVGETVVQVNGTGPFDVTYLDPADDPRKRTN